jgi:predicted lipoprotein with Yx(FWY)xxD motif
LVGLDGANYNDQSLAGTGASAYLVDPAGRTLYLFTKDTHNTNTFTKPDFSNDSVWPLDFVQAIGSIPSILDKTQFSIITTFGKTQLAYKGHPLYYFGQDNSVRGNTKGVSFPTPGAAVWKVINNNTSAL